MTDWINCGNCGYRFRSFMSACPQCSDKQRISDYTTSGYKKQKSLGHIYNSRRRIVIASSVVVICFVIVGIIFLSNPSRLDTITIDDLKQHALMKINEDRAKFGLPAVKLGENNAAQAHADDLLKTEKLSHWTTDGMKPYMRYSIYGGYDNVVQNVAQVKYGIVSITIFNRENASSDAFDELRLAACKKGIAICTDTIDPYESIDKLQYAMMYDDAKCCDNGHRYNILDKHHTHVNLGIAYNKFYFALVQNFEDKYTIWNEPISYDDISNTVAMNGIVKNDASFRGITISYDPLPSEKTYKENRDKNHYEGGIPIALVVPSTQKYAYTPKDFSNMNLVEANKWIVNNDNNNMVNSNSNKPEYNDTSNYSNFDISFSMNKLTDKYGDGVYTIETWYDDRNNEPFQATSVSLFIN